MTVKERITMIRLLQKAKKHPEFARKLVAAAAGADLRIRGLHCRGVTDV